MKNGNEIGEGNEDVGEAFNEGDDIIQGMTAPTLEKLRLENMYDKQPRSQDVIDHNHITPPYSIQKQVDDSEASAVNTGSMSCSESSDNEENQVWEFDFGEGLEPAFSEHSLMSDNSTLTSSFASEPTLKTHNDSYCEGLKRREVTNLDEPLS